MLWRWRYRGLKLQNRETSRSRTQKFAKKGHRASLVYVRTALGAGFRGFGHQKNEKTKCARGYVFHGPRASGKGHSSTSHWQSFAGKY